jgi:hypothetical protein
MVIECFVDILKGIDVSEFCVLYVVWVIIIWPKVCDVIIFTVIILIYVYFFYLFLYLFLYFIYLINLLIFLNKKRIYLIRNNISKNFFLNNIFNNGIFQKEKKKLKSRFWKVDFDLNIC